MTSAAWSKYILFQLNFFNFFSALLAGDREGLVEIAIMTIGRHFLYSNERIPLNFEIVMRAAERGCASLSSAALWLLSNAISSLPEIIDDFNIIEVVGRLTQDAAARVKCEVVSLVLSIILSGTDRHRTQCLDFVGMILEFMEMENEEIVPRAVDALARLMRVGDRDAADRFLEAGGAGAMEALAASESERVAWYSIQFLKIFPDLRAGE
jgi:hypothetical protein